MKFSTRTIAIVMAALIALLAVSVVSANNQWKSYAWESDAPPVALTLGDNTTGLLWPGHVAQAKLDWDDDGLWSEYSFITLTVTPGSATTGCTPARGAIEICNDTYGKNDWLGLAGVWVAKGKNITKAFVKVNDTYFGAVPYNTDDWRQMVMCQEIGHTFGLSHQNEDFDNPNLGSCMDYTDDPRGGEDDSNVKPNQHDFDLLEEMYAVEVKGGGGKGGGGKPDNGNGGGPPDGKGPNRFAPLAAGEWGRAIGQDASGRDNEFEQDLGNGNKLITHVLWAN